MANRNDAKILKNGYMGTHRRVLSMSLSMNTNMTGFTSKGKGIRFIVLYPPKCSHDLPPLAGTVHTETISIPRGIFQSNWQHIAHTL